MCLINCIYFIYFITINAQLQQYRFNYFQNYIRYSIFLKTALPKLYRLNQLFNIIVY